MIDFSNSNAGVALMLVMAIPGPLTASPAFAEEEPVVLQPSSKWQVDYAPDSCKLARQFGEGKDAITLILTRYTPGDGSEILLAGDMLKAIPYRHDAKVVFGPDEPMREIEFFKADLGDQPAMFLLGSHTPLQLTEEQREQIKQADESGIPVHFDETEQAARLARIAWMSFDTTFIPPIRLETGSLAKPFAAFNTCMDELVHHWGVDVPRYKTRRNGPKPIGNPGTWVTYSDYPSEELRRGGQAVVHFRVSVDPQGEVTDCHIQGATKGDAFAETTCATISKRAKFEPARDAFGAPIAGYFVNTVRFEMP